MAAQSIYRIYTQGKSREKILKLVSRTFESFTVQPIVGYFQGAKENSIVLEIVGARALQIQQLADTIRKMNGQQSVLILHLRGDAKTIRD
jgi:hypothetical protein